ncbi:MAG: hypothetical protein AB9M60_20295 [Leptothrix sp. (in: b-proteobacteria)]
MSLIHPETVLSRTHEGRCEILSEHGIGLSEAARHLLMRLNGYTPLQALTSLDEHAGMLVAAQDLVDAELAEEVSDRALPAPFRRLAEPALQAVAAP